VGTPSEPRPPLSIRVDPDVLTRLERILERMRGEFPTFRLSLSDAARMALLEGLLVLEGRAKGRKKQRSGRDPHTD
jgi:hypothetical protein